MEKKIVGFILKMKRKIDELERKNYFELLKEQCEFGENVTLYKNCSIYDGHPEIRHRQFVDIVTTGQPAWITLNDSEVEIKDDAWIGCNVIILKGVTIGKGAIVDAGSVVTHDIPDYAIAHGNPAKVYRYCMN